MRLMSHLLPGALPVVRFDFLEDRIKLGSSLDGGLSQAEVTVVTVGPLHDRLRLNDLQALLFLSRFISMEGLKAFSTLTFEAATRTHVIASPAEDVRNLLLLLTIVS